MELRFSVLCSPNCRELRQCIFVVLLISDLSWFVSTGVWHTPVLSSRCIYWCRPQTNTPAFLGRTLKCSTLYLSVYKVKLLCEFKTRDGPCKSSCLRHETHMTMHVLCSMYPTLSVLCDSHPACLNDTWLGVQRVENLNVWPLETGRQLSSFNSCYLMSLESCQNFRDNL